MTLTVSSGDGQASTPAHTAASAFTVNPDEVLAKRNALLAEAQDFQGFLREIQEGLYMRHMGGDPVSMDVAEAVTSRIRTADDSYFNVCQQWVNDLFQAAQALTELAHQYGYTDEDMAASFNRFTGSGPHA